MRVNLVIGQRANFKEPFQKIEVLYMKQGNSQLLTKKERQQFEDLCSLVSGLARSTDITLQLGPSWAWSDTQRIVYVPKDDLMDLERCKAIAAHEVGHVLYTRRLHTQYQSDDIYKPNVSTFIETNDSYTNDICFPIKRAFLQLCYTIFLTP